MHLICSQENCLNTLMQSTICTEKNFSNKNWLSKSSEDGIFRNYREAVILRKLVTESRWRVKRNIFWTFGLALLVFALVLALLYFKKIRDFCTCTTCTFTCPCTFVFQKSQSLKEFQGSCDPLQTLVTESG